MDVVTLFLILAFVAVMAVDGDDDDSITIESSCWRQILSFFPLLLELKEKQLEEVSITLEPDESSGWRGEKKGKTLYDMLLALARYPLIFDF